MSVNRREFLKVSAVGLASLNSAACWGNDELHVRLHGLLLLQKLGNKVVVHGVDAAAVGMTFHRPVLSIRKSAIDLSANNLPQTRIVPGTEGTTKETWEWDLQGKQVRFHAQEPASESLTMDVSQPTLPNPGPGGTWKSTLLLPDLKKLAGATQMTQSTASLVQIPLKDGVIEAAKPNSQNGEKILWTFKKTSGELVLKPQGLTDTALYRCPLNGEPPVIRVDSGTIAIKTPKSEFISIESMMFPKPDANPGDPFSLGHFSAFYKFVNAAFEPTETAEPPAPKDCPSCDVDPFYCPPAMI
jgi:hypothetical protein